MNSITKFMGTATLAAFMLLPLGASADSLGARGGVGVFVGQNGIVHVLGAQVASISGSVVNAVSTFGSVVLNWTVNTSNSTKIFVGGSATSSVSAIHTGDKISFTGNASSTSSPLTVTARVIHDITLSSGKHGRDGDRGEKHRGRGDLIRLFDHFRFGLGRDR